MESTHVIDGLIELFLFGFLCFFFMMFKLAVEMLLTVIVLYGYIFLAFLPLGMIHFSSTFIPRKFREKAQTNYGRFLNRVNVIDFIFDMLRPIIILAFLSAGHMDIQNAFLSIFFTLAVFLGNIISLGRWLKGSNGMAMYLGLCLVYFWPSAIVFALSWIFIAYTTRYTSIATILTLILTPIFTIYSFQLSFGLYRINGVITGDDIENLETALVYLLSFMSLIIIILHIDNIIRLIKGQERKLSRNIKKW